MLKNHKGHFGIIVCTFWMLQFDRGICNCDWILLCVVGQSQRGEDGWWCRGKEFGIRKTTGPSTGKHYWRNLDAFTLYSTIRSLMPNKTGNLCCFFLSSFRMLPFPSFSKIGIGYRGNYFVHALPIDTGNLGLTICYSPTQVNHLAPKALFFFLPLFSDCWCNWENCKVTATVHHHEMHGVPNTSTNSIYMISMFYL